MSEPSIALYSASLLSKWGFNDGDTPDEWLDYCDDHGIDYLKIDFPLVELVRRFLLPKIDQKITVVELDTHHNPIRAREVDGVDMFEVWHGKAPEPVLTPEFVTVPLSEAARVALEGE